MARKFVRASNQYLWTASPAAVAVPISMACWFNSDSLTVDQFLISIIDHSAGAIGDFFALSLAGSSGGDSVQAMTYATSAKKASSSIAYSKDTSQHACAVL